MTKIAKIKRLKKKTVPAVQTKEISITTEVCFFDSQQKVWLHYTCKTLMLANCQLENA
jgi:hypothetical protein